MAGMAILVQLSLRRRLLLLVLVLLLLLRKLLVVLVVEMRGRVVQRDDGLRQHARRRIERVHSRRRVIWAEGRYYRWILMDDGRWIWKPTARHGHRRLKKRLLRLSRHQKGNFPTKHVSSGQDTLSSPLIARPGPACG